MEFRTLKANEIDCRIQSINEKNGNVGAVVLLYKDARVDMRLLDEVVGAMNWKREHTIIGDRLYCSFHHRNISICHCLLPWLLPVCRWLPVIVRLSPANFFY